MNSNHNIRICRQYSASMQNFYVVNEKSPDSFLLFVWCCYSSTFIFVFLSPLISFLLLFLFNNIRTNFSFLSIFCFIFGGRRQIVSALLKNKRRTGLPFSLDSEVFFHRQLRSRLLFISVHIYLFIFFSGANSPGLPSSRQMGGRVLLWNKFNGRADLKCFEGISRLRLQTDCVAERLLFLFPRFYDAGQVWVFL